MNCVVECVTSFDTIGFILVPLETLVVEFVNYSFGGGAISSFV